MSLRVLVDDQITEIFNKNPELKNLGKNEFEIAVAILCNVKILHGLELEELLDGIMGNGGDEGIDLCYIFSNGLLIKDDEFSLNRESSVKVIFFQIKKEESFSTDGIRKLKEGIEEIFNLELDLDHLRHIGANSDLLRQADLIRKVFRSSRRNLAKFSCEVFYATIATNTEVATKIKHIEANLINNSLSIPMKVEYWGAQKLLDLASEGEESLEIRFDSQPLNIAEKDIKISGFAGFVNGNELMTSLIDKNNKFKSHLTEGNIRYFLGEDRKINSSIIETASDPTKSAIFWAMNNGLTIIGDSVSQVDSKTLCISNPQIVNGCQTVHCLHYAYINGKEEKLPNSLKVFVKLIESEDIEAQTDIIIATNTQNPVKSANLHANDDVQKNLEKYLKSFDYFYERRDNFYKRQRYPINKIIGIVKLTQIMHTVINKESIFAVNDTIKLFNEDRLYNSIYDPRADFIIYKFGIALYFRTWSLKKQDLRTNTPKGEERELVSKGGFIFLNIISCFLICIVSNQTDEASIKNIITSKLKLNIPKRKNEFTAKNELLFAVVNNDGIMEQIYLFAKSVLSKVLVDYKKTTDKTIGAMFKYRALDKEYVLPTLIEHMDSQNMIVKNIRASVAKLSSH